MNNMYHVYIFCIQKYTKNLASSSSSLIVKMYVREHFDQENVPICRCKIHFTCTVVHSVYCPKNLRS